MAGRSGADGKATPERIFDETKSVTASAKMHMRKLEAVSLSAYSFILSLCIC